MLKIEDDEFNFEFMKFVTDRKYNLIQIPSFFDFAANLELLTDPQGLYYLINESNSVFSLAPFQDYLSYLLNEFSLGGHVFKVGKQEVESLIT